MSTLIYIPSKHIVSFVSRNPIDWMTRDQAMMGDKAGLPPIPSVEMFLDFLLDKKTLFSQAQYWQYCQGRWNDEYPGWLPPSFTDEYNGLKAKAYRNFYPSVIDSLHVWSILSETGYFSRCILDSFEDAIQKSDITASTPSGIDIHVALVGPTAHAKKWAKYKENYRRGKDAKKCVELAMNKKWPTTSGNKRWFPQDFILESMRSVIETIIEEKKTNPVMQRRPTERESLPLRQASLFDT